MQELILKAKEESSSVTIINVIWIVQHPVKVVPRSSYDNKGEKPSLLPVFFSESLLPMVLILSSLLHQCTSAPTALHISVFYTRVGTAEHTFKYMANLPHGLSLGPGRPHIPMR